MDMNAIVLAIALAIVGASPANAKFDLKTCIARAQLACQVARCQAFGEDACGFTGTSGQGCFQVDNTTACLIDPCQFAAANACTELAIKKLGLAEK